MTLPAARSIGSPVATRDIPNGRLDLVEIDGFGCVKVRYEPGFVWSESIGAETGVAICRVRHEGYVLSGRLRVRMEDGSEAEVGAGELFVVPPGHDGRVVGDEPFEALDFAPEMRTLFN
jgi:hypothetical protein